MNTRRHHARAAATDWRRRPSPSAWRPPTASAPAGVIARIAWWVGDHAVSFLVAAFALAFIVGVCTGAALPRSLP